MISLMFVCILLSVIILLAYLFLILRHSKQEVSYLYLISLVVIWCVTYVCITGNFGTKETSFDVVKVIQVPDDASIYLSSGFSSYAHVESDTFVLTKDTSLESLREYLGNTKKNVYFYVKDGSSILYSYNYGLSSDDNAEDMLDKYSSIRESNEIRVSISRYTILNGLLYYNKEEF